MSGSRLVARAGAGTAAWETAARLQRQLRRPEPGDLYPVVGELVATVRALEDLAVVLAGQLTGLHGRAEVFDDSDQAPRPVSVPARLAEAVAGLGTAGRGLAAAAVGVERAWSAIGHLGIDPGRGRR